MAQAYWDGMTQDQYREWAREQEQEQTQARWEGMTQEQYLQWAREQADR